MHGTSGVKTFGPKKKPKITLRIAELGVYTAKTTLYILIMCTSTIPADVNLQYHLVDVWHPDAYDGYTKPGRKNTNVHLNGE